MKRKMYAAALVTAAAAMFLLPPVSLGAGKFRIGHTKLIMGSPAVVADRLGYFDRTLGKGKYVVKTFKMGKLMMQALLSNSLDVGGAASRPFVTSTAKSERITGLGISNYYCRSAHLMVRTDSKIRSVADMKGKRLGIGKASGTNFIFRNFIAPAHGLKKGDWTVINTLATDRIAALRSGNVEMIMVANPSATIAQQKGYARTLENYCKYAKVYWLILTRKKAVEEQSDRVVKFLRGWLRAVRLQKENPALYARTYWQHLQSKGSKISRELVRKNVDDLEFPAPLVDENERKWLVGVAKVLKKEKKLPRTRTFQDGDGFDLAPLRKALKAEGMM